MIHPQKDFHRNLIFISLGNEVFPLLCTFFLQKTYFYDKKYGQMKFILNINWTAISVAWYVAQPV